MVSKKGGFKRGRPRTGGIARSVRSKDAEKERKRNAVQKAERRIEQAEKRDRE